MNTYSSNDFDNSHIFNQSLLKHKKIHIAVQQRNTRQKITTISDLPENLDLKNIRKIITKKLCCNGTIIDKENSKILRFTGDQRNEIAKYLISNNIADKEDIVIHGY